MFSRVIYERWHEWVPLVAFVVTSFVYGLMTVRGLMLRKDKADRMSNLPLD